MPVNLYSKRSLSPIFRLKIKIEIIIKTIDKCGSL